MTGKTVFSPSELILNEDGSIYHLHLRKEHLAKTILLVGDPGRVGQISRHFDSIEYKIANREFITHTGSYRSKRITVSSTGIGTDNIDVVLNELDAVANIDLNTRCLYTKIKRLNIIRLGTSGALHKDIEVGSFIISSHAIGMDQIPFYYGYSFSPNEYKLMKQLEGHLGPGHGMTRPYVVEGSQRLISELYENMQSGITLTATGFYAPQGRQLRLRYANQEFHDSLRSFESGM